MGAWGAGPFENDAALDFLAGLSDRDGDVTGGLRDGMAEAVNADGYLDYDEVCYGLAAACLVAARVDGPEMDGVNGRDHLDGLTFTVDDDLRALAARVFVRAFEPEDNEWYDLWDESGAIPEVKAALEPYRAVLGRG